MSFKPISMVTIALALANGASANAQDADQFEQITKIYMQGLLKDPDSAQWQLVKGPFPDTRGKDSGMAVCYRINARNSYGGYTGYKVHYFLIGSNNVIFHVPKEVGISSELASIEREIAQAFCQ